MAGKASTSSYAQSHQHFLNLARPRRPAHDCLSLALLTPRSIMNITPQKTSPPTVKVPLSFASLTFSLAAVNRLDFFHRLGLPSHILGLTIERIGNWMGDPSNSCSTSSSRYRGIPNTQQLSKQILISLPTCVCLGFANAALFCISIFAAIFSSPVL